MQLQELDVGLLRHVQRLLFGAQPGQQKIHERTVVLAEKLLHHGVVIRLVGRRGHDGAGFRPAHGSRLLPIPSPSRRLNGEKRPVYLMLWIMKLSHPIPAILVAAALLSSALAKDEFLPAEQAFGYLAQV